MKWHQCGFYITISRCCHVDVTGGIELKRKKRHGRYSVVVVS
jgi:hypothetical protein